MTVAIDKPVPAFSAKATGDKTLDNDALRGSHAVIYFYPKDNTPGCTSEGQDFRDHHAAFEAENCRIIGVSRDSLRTHENFKAKHGFPFELISDPDEVLCNLFDVIKLKKLYGKEHMGVERSTFLVDKDGVLRQAWRKVKVKGHVEEVLEAVKELNKA